MYIRKYFEILGFKKVKKCRFLAHFLIVWETFFHYCGSTHGPLHHRNNSTTKLFYKQF